MTSVHGGQNGTYTVVVMISSVQSVGNCISDGMTRLRGKTGVYKKRALVLIAGVGVCTVIALSGCEEQTITYQKEVMTLDEAEEKIADQLEVENTDLDLEVRITEESDD